jgi:dynein light chain 1
MAQATSIKEAIARFERDEYERRCKAEEIDAEKDGRERREIEPVIASQEKYVKLMGMLPPIMRLDKDLATLGACEHLGLSTNLIERLAPGFKELKNLRVLSLGRNNIRKLELLELPQLEQLWLSYNKIDKLSGLDKLKNLKVLYMSNNLIGSWQEIDRLANQCPELADVLFINNPIHSNAPSEKDYRLMMLQRLPKLQVLDGAPVEPEEREEAEKLRGA